MFGTKIPAFCEFSTKVCSLISVFPSSKRNSYRAPCLQWARSSATRNGYQYIFDHVIDKTNRIQVLEQSINSVQLERPIRTNTIGKSDDPTPITPGHLDRAAARVPSVGLRAPAQCTADTLCGVARIEHPRLVRWGGVDRHWRRSA